MTPTGLPVVFTLRLQASLACCSLLPKAIFTLMSNLTAFQRGLQSLNHHSLMALFSELGKNKTKHRISYIEWFEPLISM